MENITHHFQNLHAHSVSLWQIYDQSIIREMKAQEATMVLPIYRDKDLAGIMFLGPSTRYRELYESEIEMLSILLNHLVTAVNNTRLIQDKLELERRMFASEKWMSLGRLSGQIAHEVKNPLSSIKSITHVMREELGSDSQFYKDLSMVEGEIDKLAAVVNQLLQGARPETQDEQSADVYDIVENVANVLRTEATQNNIEIKCHFEDGIPAIRANPLALREIVFNVMNNGIQSISSDGTLSVSVVRSDPSEKAEMPSILVVVHDTGPGIPEEDIPKILDPFYTTKEGGTGLGLWIVNEKLTDLGGHMSVEGKEGTTVSITVPLEARPANGRSDATRSIEALPDSDSNLKKETGNAGNQDTLG
jgi:signal transduction histidine kinase